MCPYESSYRVDLTGQCLYTRIAMPLDKHDLRIKKDCNIIKINYL